MESKMVIVQNLMSPRWQIKQEMVNYSRHGNGNFVRTEWNDGDIDWDDMFGDPLTKRYGGKLPHELETEYQKLMKNVKPRTKKKVRKD